MRANRRLTVDEVAVGHTAHNQDMRKIERDLCEDHTRQELIASLIVILLFILPIVLWPAIYSALGAFWAGVCVGAIVAVSVMLGLLAIGIVMCAECIPEQKS